MAAATNPATSGIPQSPVINKEDENNKPPTVEEILIQVENHLYKSPEHRASLLIAVWSCLGSGTASFRNIENVFRMLYRETAMMIFGGHWPKINIMYKRGLSRALIQYSHSMGVHIKGSEGMCSALVMAAYDAWGDPSLQMLLSQQEINLNLVSEFVKSEPRELLLIRVECLVKAHCEEAAIRILKCSLQCLENPPPEDECGYVENWRLAFKEWLLRLLFRKRRLNDLIAESSSCSCHDGVRLIRQTFHSDMEDSESLTETLINLFLVRDLLFQSTYCCTAELMRLWCELQAKNKKSSSEIQEAACKLLVGHASSSAQFYLFVDVLWEKFGASLLPLYLEMYIRGLTSDLNFLEAARQADNKEYVIEIENHMAAMYFKLFSLFNGINKEVALECLMSAFSLDPTKERLEWIKKLSLQITKEKAIKNTNREDSKHKSCSRSGCPHNCVHHPSPVKRKAVVMCDQAIQVGDDLAEVEALVKFPDTNNQGSCDIRPVSCDNLDPVIESKVTNESDTNSCVNVDKEDILCRDTGKTFSELNHSDKVEEIKVSGAENVNNECDKRPTVDVVNLSQDTGQLSSTGNLSGIGVETKAAKQEDYEGNISSVNDSVDIKSDIKDIHTSSKLENKLEVFNSVENHLKHKNKVKHTSFSAHNHMSENDKQVENNCLSFSIDKLVLPCKTDKMNSLSQPHESTERINANCIIDKMEIETSVSSDLKNCFSIDKSVKQTPNTTTLINETLCPDENVKNQTNIFINGYRETERIINEDDKNNLNLNEKHIIENQDMLTDSKDSNPEINEPTPSKIQPIANGNETMQNCILNLQDSSVVSPEKSIEGFTSENPKETNLNFNTMEPRVTRRSEALKNLNLDRFSHIVLDSKIPDLSSEALSDLVAVLESLRNRQLKSSCKWSQIKHLFENYLENIVTLRCSIMNNQAYGSMDSETDSVSELTTDGFKDLDFPQSQESVVEDPFVNKTHVLKRFMNSDKATEMATYVNLSDIHCPQIPLEKLFYTDHSSSHVGHKKRHKRHRNHENKIPEKLALKKFRHGSRAERDLIKRKKRKKRKAKKGKGHTKKHCFTHGKITKSYVKNKKKKHKLKKKKDGNSGFISGDYCSDFSSEKLMQLVKEHSNSYSKMPATTSKHPHTSALVTRSASSSDLSEEPLKKKQKVGFSKKRSHSNKHRDKHKHIKKSSKRKKTIVVETCGAGFNDVINEGDMGNNIESVKDYSHFVQYSSVKKMEAVQIRQRSVALNLSKVNNKSQNLLPSSNNPCIQNPQLQEFVHQKFESYSPEDLIKMQLMMSDQQTNVPAMSNSISAANNQAVLKYFTTKTTSRLMSVAEANALGVLGSDSEASKSPIPPFSDNSNVQKITTIHPTNLPPNVKHLIISGNTAYQVPNSTSVTTVSSIIPINFSGNTYSNISKYTGTAHPTNVKTSTNATSPQVTTFTIPVSHPMGSRLIGNKLVIPLPPCGHVNKTTSSLALLPAVTSTYSSLQGNPPNVILVKSGTNTQLIQQPGLSSSLLNNAKFMPIARNISTNPLVTKTAPKLIKQATKRLTQPLIKRPVVKTQLFPNAVTNKPADKTLLKVVDSSDKISPITTLDAGKSQIEPTPESLLVQRAIEEAKRAIAESAPDKLHETKRGSKSKKENAEEKFLPKTRTSEVKVVSESIKDGKSEQPENKKPPAPSNFEATHILATSSAVINAICDQVDAIPSPTDNNTDIKIVSSPVDNFVSEEKMSKEQTLLKGISGIESNKLVTEVKSVIEIEQSDTIKNDTKPKSVPSPKPMEVDHLNDVHVETTPLKTDAASKKDQVGIASVDVAIIEPQETKLPQLITGAGISTAKSAEPVTPEKIERVDSDKAISLNQNVSQLELSQTLHNGHKKPSKELGKEQKDNITSIDEQKEPPMKCAERPKEPQKQSCEKRNEFQPINAENSNPALKMSSKAESRAPASEAQTRSFTSISDAVRFSLMDMDDGTDSVENQVLQAFQVSHETAPESPSYDNNSSNDGDASVASSAVILTTPQNATTTELSVSRVSQRFEASVHASQTEKFADCQSTVSRTTTWVLDDSSLNETSQVLGGSKSQDIDSSEETKDDERPKKKKKRRDRCERDLEAMHKFWCEICHKGFFSAYNLRRHCRNVHKMDLPKGSTDLPFGQKSSPEMAYANNSQCHKQGESSSSDIVTPPRLSYAQQACVSPKGAEFVLQSPTCENKNQEFPMKSASSQHTTHVQASDFQMQTPPRMPSQSPSAHVSNVSPAKDFRLPASTAASQVQLSPSKMTSATKSPSSPKFQRLPTPCSTATVPQLAKVSQQISQISLCGQPTLQQQMQLSQLQQSVLMQQLPGASCQAQQQLQVAQCPHFQANKQTAQQSIGQLQLMHHAGQLPQVQHATHVVPKQAQVQSYKKCTASQQASKMADSEQLQQAAQLAQTQQAAQLVQTQQAAQMAQTQQMLANQHLQKLMHLRQNAMVATVSTPQLSLATGIQGSPSKASAQCFRAQLAAAQQVAAATASQQRSQGTTYSLAPHNSAAHQFFPPGQSNQDQSNCPHAFTTQNIVEFSTSGPSYPTIRLSSETNDGLEDLEQFLLENMPWSGETAHPHGISQQTGNRPSSADSLTLAIPTSTSQNRTAAQAKNKTSISRPKPRKPNTPSCSKNLIGNLGRSVKKKPPSKKTSKSSDTDCSGLKPDLFLQTSIINQQAHVMDSMHRQCSKGTSSDLLSSKTASKNTAISSINENDSSDSVQCINVNLNPHTKICSNINFSTFPTAEKNINSFCNTDPNSTRLYGEHNKNSFLGQRNLVNKDCSNLGNSSINSSLCDTDPLHAGSPFAFAAKESVPNSRTTFYPNERSLVCPNRPETSTADFLGQRNIENCDLMTSGQRNVSFNTQDTSNNPSGPSTSSATIDSSRPTVSDIHDLFLGGKTANNNNSAVSFKKDSVDIDSGSVTNKVSSLSGGVTSKIPNSHTKKGESVASSFKVTVSGKKGVIFSDDDCTAPENDDHSKSQNFDVSNCATENHLKQDESASNVSDKNLASILKNDNLPNDGLKIKDINFNYVSSKEELNSSVLISETNCGETENSLSVSNDTNLKKNLVEYESNEILSDFDNLNQKLVNCENNYCKTEENGLVDSEIKQNDLIDQLITSSPKKGDIIAKSKVLNNCDNDYLKLNYESQENLSSHKNKILNGVSHTSELVYSEEENENSGGLRHITLRIHKSQNIVSNNNKVNSKQNLTENSSTDIKKITKKSHKKKSNNNKMNNEVKEMSIKKNPPPKLDINSNIHNIGISDVDGIDKNTAQSRVPTLCDKIPVETQENVTIFEESKPVLPPEQILPGRLRLRDTPKTSVKRTCPCCVENGTPKKCRTPVNKSPVKIFGTSGQNNKSKPDSKTKNMHKGKKAKANVRSSPRRLRSRNNAIS
ncbi:hypothetical protein JTE90_021169 [Oedothorax gibbosus]|uniref:C2H2-type domain-containing protein n=1 Tax=Oedothorax gibbosus TaxID=931172 RepID=A0AAV6V4H3_9ARAC|nr:hypothetical protein JTE90_021169 [Oedothorax gibbosus]